jgi:hypothetical protein
VPKVNVRYRALVGRAIPPGLDAMQALEWARSNVRLSLVRSFYWGKRKQYIPGAVIDPEAYVRDHIARNPRPPRKPRRVLA